MRHNVDTACTYFASHNDELVKASQEVSGPLMAHGFIVQMLHFCVLEKSKPSRTSIQLGVSNNHYRLMPMTSKARTAIKCMLDLHDTMDAILDYGAPVTLAQWNMQANLLRKSFSRHRVAGLLSRGYACDWCIRALLDAVLHATQGKCLQVLDSDRLQDLPGPDANGNLVKIGNALGTQLVRDAVRILEYTGSVHLLSMFACLATWRRAETQKEKKRSSILVDGNDLRLNLNLPQAQSLYFTGNETMNSDRKQNALSFKMPRLRWSAAVKLPDHECSIQLEYEESEA